MTEILHIRLLDDFYLVYDDTPVTTIVSSRLQSLLAYLVLHCDAPQPRHHLAFLFWPDSTEAQARGNLRNLMYLLRRALPDADHFLHADVQTVQWRPDASFIFDVADFESALTQAEQAEQAGDQTKVREALEKAVSLYRGDLLPSCYDDWILPERERLRQALVGALERLILLLEEQRDYRAALGYAQRLLRHDPLHEAAYRGLMRLHALSNDRASALRVYHTCVTVLQRELGVEPSLATREAYERLLQREALPGPPLAPPAGLVASSPLVGRHQEWTQLQVAWRTATGGTLPKIGETEAVLAGRPRFVMVSGEAGIGKTRLADELVRWVRQQGMATATARCYAAEGELAYAPVVTWLRARPLPLLEPTWRSEIARLLPELLVEQPDLSPPDPLTEAWQRQHLFEALARAVLGGRQPLLLTLDDLQWCDQGTLEWLHYLLRFDPRARLLVVGTLRLEEMQDDHPLLSWLQALRREGLLTETGLGPLDEAETMALAANVAGRELNPDLAASVYRETEGNPLFVVEMVRARLPVGDRPQSLPPKVQGVLESRLTQLSSPARELVGLAATVGREFTFAVLAQASDLNQNTLIRALDELWQRRIAREQGADAYDFSHDKLREVAYAGLSTARRRLLHRQVAQALEEVYAGNLDAISAQAAAHYERAGRPEQAVPYYLRAAQVARRIYANEEAIRYYQRVLALLDRSPPVVSEAGLLDEPRKSWQLEALRGLGQVYFEMGKVAGAEEYLREAIAVGREIGLAARQMARRRIREVKQTSS